MLMGMWKWKVMSVCSVIGESGEGELHGYDHMSFSAPQARLLVDLHIVVRLDASNFRGERARCFILHD
jgi:hypothetical protein